MINTTNLNSPSYSSSSSHSSSSKPSKLTQKVENAASQISLDHSQRRKPRALSLYEKFVVIEGLRQKKGLSDIAKFLGRDGATIVDVEDAYSKNPQKYEEQFRAAYFYARPLIFDSKAAATLSEAPKVAELDLLKEEDVEMTSESEVETEEEESQPLKVKNQHKHRWTEEENEKLLGLIKKHRNPRTQKPAWPLIAEEMGENFTSKKCRERFHNHLEKDVDHTELTDFEKEQIIQFEKEKGPKWAILAKQMNRTDLKIRNFWHNHCRKVQNNGGTKRKPDDNLNLKDDESPKKKKKADRDSSSSSSSAVPENQHLIENDHEMSAEEQTPVLAPKEETHARPKRKIKLSTKSRNDSGPFTLEEQFEIVQLKKQGKNYVKIGKKLEENCNAIADFYLFDYYPAPKEYEDRFRQAGLYDSKPGNSKPVSSAEVRPASQGSESSPSSQINGKPMAGIKKNELDNDQEMMEADQAPVLAPVAPPVKPQKRKIPPTMKGRNFSGNFTLEEQFKIVQGITSNAETYEQISNKLSKKMTHVYNFYAYGYSHEPEKYEAQFKEAGFYNNQPEENIVEEQATSYAQPEGDFTPQPSNPSVTSPVSHTTDVSSISAPNDGDVEMVPEEPQMVASNSVVAQPQELQLVTQQAVVNEAFVELSVQPPTKPSDSSIFGFNPIPLSSFDEALANSGGWEAIDFEKLAAFNDVFSPVSAFYTNAPVSERPVSPSTRDLFDSLPTLMELND